MNAIRPTFTRRAAALFSLSLAASMAACGADPGGPAGPSAPGGGPAPEEACSAVSGPGTVHETDVTADETWRAEDGPHLVRGRVAVRAGAHLTIAPCAELRLEPEASLDVGVASGDEAARLSAEGTARRPIRFVRSGAEAWSSLAVFAPSRATLRHVTLEGGGSDRFRDRATLYVLGDWKAPSSSPLLVDHVTVRGSRGHGVVMAHAATFDPASTWLDVTGSGADGGGYPLVIGEHVLGSVPDGSYLGNQTDEILVLEDGANGFIGLQTDATVRRRTAPYRVGELAGQHLQVGGSGPGGALVTLTIEAGVEMRFSKDAKLLVHSDPDRPRGALRVLGTAEAPVLLTATAAERRPGGWSGLWFDAPVAAENEVGHARIEYAGGYCSCSLTSCNVVDGYDAAVVFTGPPPRVFLHDSTIAASAGHGVLRSWTDDATLDFMPTNTFEGVAKCRQTLPGFSDRVCPDPALRCD